MVKRIPAVLVLLLASGLLIAWGKDKGWVGRLVQPGEVTQSVEWVDAEKKSDIAIRKLRETADASFQIVRMNTAEKPHVHEHHDLTVFVLRGRALMHLDNKDIPVRAGDVIDIPRGVPHWVENKSAAPSEVYAIFTPAFDGKDTVFIDTSSTPA
ncbi:MAG: cupin domain-containing protein [Candidatus Omnitrophica bacterium]|nr:cupin domain-containing protein [Candidatus Omnitrophota bacterium]